MSRSEVFAVCGFHTQRYCTISLHLAAFCIMCYSLYGHIRTSASCCSWSVAIGTPPALMISCKWPLRDDKVETTKYLPLCINLSLDLFLPINVHIYFDVLLKL